MCRRWTSGIEMGVQVPAGGLTWTGGEEHLKAFRSSDWAERVFCSACGSNLIWRLTAEGPAKGMMSASFGALDSIEGMTFDAEVFVDHCPPSHAFAPGERTRMTEAEVLAMVGAPPPGGVD
jgi:hypothetical protein